MSVDLTGLKINGDEIMPVSLGGVIEGLASDEYQERMGDRWAAQVSTPAMRIEPDGRRWAARLLRARREGAIVEIHQPGFNVGTPGTPVVASNTPSGKAIPISGLTPYYPIREGQWLNYIIAGQHYLDQVTAEVVANGAGLATVSIQNLLRVPLTAGATIVLARPCIEGLIKGDFSIPRSVDRITSFSFLIAEKS